MTLTEIIFGSGGAVAILLTLIQIIPVKVNPWSWIARQVGNALTRDLDTKVSDIAKRTEELAYSVANLERQCEEREAVQCRARILRFSDEMYQGLIHSREHFESILEGDIPKYDYYCQSHPEFKNDMTLIAEKRIRQQYEECMTQRTFLS